MNPPKENIGGHFPMLQYPQEMLGASFKHRNLPNTVVGVILAGPSPAFLRCAALHLDNLLHHCLPGAPGGFWITGCQIGAGNMAIYSRLLLCLILDVQKPLSCGFVVSFKALPFAGEPVEDVENTAMAAIHAEPLLHDFVHERNDPGFQGDLLACSR